MRPDTEPWWRQAEADLETAELTLGGGQWYAASWFAQQAAEKALKALTLEQTATDPPRTHDLRLLGRLVGATSAIEQDLTLLYPIFSLSRYPDAHSVAPIDAIGQVDATQHVDAARRVLRWIRPLL